MSRRAKVALTLFLLLCAASVAAFLALSWSTQNPLCFRNTGRGVVCLYASSIRPDSKVRLVPLEFEVRNHASFPIHLYSAGLLTSRSPNVRHYFSSMAPGTRYMPEVQSAEEYPPIPENGRMTFQVYVKEDEYPLLLQHAQELRFGYAWQSPLQRRAYLITQWVHNHLPAIWRSSWSLEFERGLAEVNWQPEANATPRALSVPLPANLVPVELNAVSSKQ